MDRSGTEQPSSPRRLDLGFSRLDRAGRLRWLALFAAAYVALLFVGHALREGHEHLTVVWPTAGLLLLALWLTPTRGWPALLAIQVAVELLVVYFWTPPFRGMWSLLFALANSSDAIAGALVARRLVADVTIPRILQVLAFFAAAAVGASVSATIGGIGASTLLNDPAYLHQWQLWWAGNWLGSLTMAPVILTWLIRWRLPALSVQQSRFMPELALIGAALVGFTAWIFSAQPGGTVSILQLPFVLLALLILAAFRLPPRWASTLAALVVAVAAAYASQRLGPFAEHPNAFMRIAGLQVFLATLVTLTFMIATILVQQRRTLAHLSLSDQRYRSFVQHSSEAVWRIELAEPLPLSLPVSEQIEWLKRHAYIAECNVAYRRLHEARRLPPEQVQLWRADVPWAAIYLEHLESAAQKRFSADELRFELDCNGEKEVHLAAFSGVEENGAVVRIWGVARNVSHLAELNDRLRRERERLRSYAQQLTSAEERARRATAVDLHDGIGQLLVGLGMKIDVLASQASAGVQMLYEEMRAIVREVQEKTSRVIADLSPPGLYDLGLGAALEWLAVYMRTHDKLQVTLRVTLDERALSMDLRVLVFKVVRELLRNVVKHARVDAADVLLTQREGELAVEVSDKGLGFQWQLDLFTDPSQRFGLFSIADRVRVARGQFSIDAAPGKGCRARMVFPLERPQESSGSAASVIIGAPGILVAPGKPPARRTPWS